MPASGVRLKLGHLEPRNRWISAAAQARGDRLHSDRQEGAMNRRQTLLSAAALMLARAD